MNDNLIPINILDMVRELNNPNIPRQNNEFYLKKLNDIVAFIQTETNKYHMKHAEQKKKVQKKKVQKKIVDQIASKPDTRILLNEKDED